MNRNPYAAPETTVADRAELPGQRPKEVAYAVWLLWTSIAVVVIASLLNFKTLKAEAALPLVLVIAAFIIVAETVFLAWVTSRVAAGRNWARWLLLVLAAGGVLSALLDPHATLMRYSSRPLFSVLSAVNGVLQFVALGLLFTPRAGAWFEANRGR